MTSRKQKPGLEIEREITSKTCESETGKIRNVWKRVAGTSKRGNKESKKVHSGFMWNIDPSNYKTKEEQKTKREREKEEEGKEKEKRR